jgi:hypothetical protein
VTREEGREEGRKAGRKAGREVDGIPDHKRYAVPTRMSTLRRRKGITLNRKRKQPKLSYFGQQESRFQRALLHSEKDRVYSKNL